MKIVYISLMAFGFARMGHSQITLSGTDFNGAIGDSYDVVSTTWMSEGSSGASQTWDLSGMIDQNTNTTIFGAASGTFAGANIAQNTAGSSIEMLQNSSGQYVHGINAGGTMISYSNPMTFLEFPLTMSTTGSDSHLCTFTSSGYAFTRAGTSSWEVDGWGSVTTPNGTYNNVLRVKINQDYTDTYSLGTIDYAVEIYQWMSAGIHVPVASVTTVVTDLGSNEYGSYYSGNAGVDVLSKTKLSVFPNPVKDNIYFSTEEDEIESIVITDLSGKVLLSVNQFNANEPFNISELNSGVYFVTLNLPGGKKSGTERFVKM